MNDAPASDRASTQLLLNRLMLGIATCATLIALWLVIGSLTHATRERVLMCLVFGLFVSPIVLLVLPRTCAWISLVVAGWAVVLGIRYCGDMGADGHYITATFVFFAACWAILIGIPMLVVRGLLFRVTELRPRFSQQARWHNMTTIATVLVMACAVVFLFNRALAEYHKHQEHKRLAAPFEAVGMLVFFEASGGISIQCDNPRFGDPQLLAVIDQLRELNDLKILNLYFTSISDASLPELTSLENLEHLVLFQTHVTDAGIEHLVTMRHLEQLDLRETDVTDKGIADLQRALPDCFILH